MLRRCGIALAVLTLPLALVASQLSYRYDFGIQSHGWSLAASDGYVSLLRWLPGRDPSLPLVPTRELELAIDSGSRLAQVLRSVGEIVVLDENRAPLATGVAAAFRQEYVAGTPLASWDVEPLVPARRLLIWLEITGEEEAALIRARRPSSLLVAAKSWRRLPATQDSPTPLFSAACLDLSPGQPVYCASQHHVSLWLIAAGLCAPVVLLAARRLHTLLRAARHERHGLCLACGYDLRGSSLRCPECSAPFPSGAQSQRLRAVRWALRIGQCAGLALCLAGLISSYFATTFRGGHAQIVLSGASIHVNQLGEAVAATRLGWTRLYLPLRYPYAPRLSMSPLRVTIPMWMPTVALILTLYWFEIRPGRPAGARQPRAGRSLPA